MSLRNLCILAGCALLSGCNSTGTAPTPAQIQADLQTAILALKTAGCFTAAAGSAAAPIIAVTADDQGNKVLSAVTASGAALCTAPAPATVASPAGTTLGAVAVQ